MKFNVYIAAAAAVFGLADAQCDANNCARAVTGTRRGLASEAAHRADCSSFQRTTFTVFSEYDTTYIATSSSTFTLTVAPTTVTVTTTVTPFVFPTFSDDLPEPPTVTAFTGPDRRDVGEIDARQLVSSFQAIPVYASACDGASAYRSACSCWGVTPSFIYITAPGTTTFTGTSYDYDYVTVVDTTGVTTTTVRITSTPGVTASSDEASPTITSSSLGPTATSDEPSATETDEPSATETEEPSSTETEEPSATETEEPSATETEEPSATETEEPSATETEEPSATETEEPSATQSDESSTETEGPTATPTDDEPSVTATAEEPSATETEEPTSTEIDEPTSTTDFEITSTELPTTLVTSVVSLTSEDPSSTTTDDVTPSSTTGLDLCQTFGNRFPYTPLSLLSFCTCTYANPVCGRGFSATQRSFPLIIGVETCANTCDLFSNCRAFSYNPRTLECLVLDAGAGLGYDSNFSDWVYVERQPNTCQATSCNTGAFPGN